jgi:tricorn protease-like protein
MRKNLFLFLGAIVLVLFFNACGTMNTSVSYSSVSVPEEGGINFVKITDDADVVANPGVTVRNNLINSNTSKLNVEWWINPVIAVSPDGEKIAYINYKNQMKNIMVKSATSGGASIQRTFRNDIWDFSWSPDGKQFCFTELRNKIFGIYMVNADQGTVVRQISANTANDFAPIMSQNGKEIFFHRGEGYYNYSLWSFNIENNIFSNYSRGMTPCLVPNDPNAIYTLYK